MAYILPQVQVFQEFSVLPTAVVQNLNSFVFGANYQLFRYAEAAEKALVALGSYDKDSDTAYSWPNQPTDSVVDLEYTKLYMEDVWAEYLEIVATETAPLLMVSAAQRNKLRAAPVIGAALPATDQVNPWIETVEDSETFRGYFTGHVALPEYYYFYATGGADGSGDWDADEYSATVDVDDARLSYITTEGLTGYVDVLATNSPLDANVATQGPDGLQLNVSPGSADNVWNAPRVIRFANDDGSVYFDISVDLDEIKQIIDWGIDSPGPALQIIVDLETANTESQGFLDNKLTINTETTTSRVLSELHEALTTGALGTDIAPYFNVSDIVGSVATQSVAQIIEEDLVSGTDTTGTFVMVPNAFRISVTPNQYLFKTGNGYSHSDDFNSRGVLVGDRVRYSVTTAADVTYTGTTKVTGFEADATLAAIAAAAAKSTNQATQTGTVLLDASAAPNHLGGDIVVAGTDNQRAMDGADTELMSLDDTIGSEKYTGELSSGVVGDKYTVAITTPGAAGTAVATVSNDSGTYYREGVKIEIAGSNDGQIYVGRNLVINFEKGTGDSDATFQAGDSYTLSADILAPFTAVSGLTMVASSGTYTGLGNTTYIAEVVRGGAFDRQASVIKGLANPATAVLTVAGTDFSSWTGGDVDDEYILKVTTAGALTTALFSVESLKSDNSTGISFPAEATDVALGGRGLVGQFNVDDVFDLGDYWVIRVNASRPQIKVSDSAGIDQGSLEIIDNGVAEGIGGYGVKLTFATNVNTEAGFVSNGGLLKGDVFNIVVTASGDGAYRTLVLADDLPSEAMAGLAADGVTSNTKPEEFAAWLYLVQSSALIGEKKLQNAPDYNWVDAADDVTVNSAIAVQDASWYESDSSQPWLPVYSADMFVEYRALIKSYSDTIHNISDIGDTITTLGVISPDNPLSQGVYNSLSNSGNRAVYYMAVPSDDHAGYLSVLDRASLNEDVYGFVPLSRDGQVLNSVEAHINTMSTETNKRWRIGFFGTEMDIEASVYDLSKNPLTGEPFYCTIEDDTAVTGLQYTVLTFVEADGTTHDHTEATADLAAGDKIRTNYGTDQWLDPTYDEYEIASVVSNTKVKLKSGPPSEVTAATKVEAWHDFSVQEMADDVAATSSGFANRRVYHVFPDVLGAFGVSETAEFGAAAVSGLCSSVSPQQGLTNIELNGFDDLPRVYSTFSHTQLNKMAEYGTMIIMQDVAGGRIYIRHQVSTNTISGDLNQTELSVTKNLDSISYYFADRLEPFIGRYNITPELLAVLRAQIEDGLFFLGSFTNVGLLGPQVLLDGTEIRTVEVHPTLADHVVAIVDVQLPYPLNVLELHLVV